jgi:hypothetical protein
VVVVVVVVKKTQTRSEESCATRAGLVMACQVPDVDEARIPALCSARGCVSAGTLDTGPGVNEHRDAIVREKSSGWATAGDGAGLLECVGAWVGREVDGERFGNCEGEGDPLVYWIG